MWRRAIRDLRQRSGLSQRQLAMRMGVPRTYVSKIENEKATPTLSSLARLASALEVERSRSAAGLRLVTRRRDRDLLADPFVAELVEFTSQAEHHAAFQRAGAGAGHGHAPASRSLTDC